MSLLKSIFRGVSSTLPAGPLHRLSGQTILLPYHHVVSDEYLPHIRGLYPCKNKKQFIADLDWLLARYRPVHPLEVAEAVFQLKPLPSKSFLLSFDDGYRSVYEVIAPVLKQKGVPALFFLNPAFIDNRQLFYRCILSLVWEKCRQDPQTMATVANYLGAINAEPQTIRKNILAIQYPDRQKADALAALCGIDIGDFLRIHQPFLTTAQLFSLHEDGFVLGGHSVDHPHYRYLTLDEQEKQTRLSVEFAGRFQPGLPRFFAFPHEDKGVRQEFFDRFKGQTEPILFFGTQNGRHEIHNRLLQRFNAEQPGISFSALVKSMLFYGTLMRMGKMQKGARNTG
jgi:peptidoglycan/xylan/chitin deacetylase (PgdA/CDA1 family)